MVDQAAKVAQHGRCQRTVANEKSHLDVAVKGGLREVGRGHKYRFVVGHNGLGMEHTAGSVQLERARVVIHGWAR